MSSYILTNLLERIDSLESKIYHIESRQCCLYGSKKDKNIFEYLNCLLSFSKNLKKDLLYKKIYCKPKDKQIMAQMCDRISVLESEILNRFPPQVTCNLNPTTRYFRKIYSTESVQCNKPRNYCKSNVLGRCVRSLDEFTPTYDSRKCELRFFEKLPCKLCESKNVSVEESSSDLSEYIVLSDSSSTFSSRSETSIIINEDNYYIESTPVGTRESRKKTKYERYKPPTVPVSIHRSEAKPSRKRTASAKPKSKQYVGIKSSNLQRNKKKGNKHNPKRKKDHKKFRLEKSDSQRAAVHSGKHHLPNNKTEVYFVKRNSASPWHNEKNGDDLKNLIKYLPYSKENNDISGKVSTQSRKVHRGSEVPFSIPTDQTLYYVAANPASTMQNKPETQILSNDGNNKHNSKTSIESEFIKSKWRQNLQYDKKGFNGYGNLGIEPDNTNGGVVLPEHKFNSGDQNSHLFYKGNQQLQKKNNGVDDSKRGIATINEIYSVINTNPNGDILLKKLSHRDVLLLRNESSKKTANGFEIPERSIIPGRNEESTGFSKPFGGTRNEQSVFISSVPLNDHLPSNSGVKQHLDDISDPNNVHYEDKQSVSGTKPSFLVINPNEPNYDQAGTNAKSRGLRSSISRLPSKLMSNTNNKKDSNNSLKDYERKTSSSESKKNKKNKFESRAVLKTPIENNFSEQKKSMNQVQDENVKPSQGSLRLIFQPNEKTRFGKIDSTDSEDLYRHGLKYLPRNYSEQTEDASIPTIIIPIKENKIESKNHIKTVFTPKSNGKNHSPIYKNESKLNYSLHFEKERRVLLETSSIPNTLSLTKLIAMNCNRVKSEREVIISEHKLNGNEYHNKVREFFTNSACCKNKKILIKRPKCCNGRSSQNNCKCNSCKNCDHCHAKSTNYDPTTDGSNSLDWKTIAHKIKEQK